MMYPCHPPSRWFSNMNIWHAAYGGAVGRRHLAVNFVPEATEPEHVELMKTNHRTLINLMERFQYSQPGPAFTDDFHEQRKAAYPPHGLEVGGTRPAIVFFHGS